MSFTEKYTTAELVLKEKEIDLSSLPKEYVLESKKIVLSNDFYMLGQMLECLINKGLR